MNRSVAQQADRTSRLRWLLCALLFAATAINYMDRSVLGLLAHTLEGEIGWSEASYSHIVVAFTFAYGLGYLAAGRIIDGIGAKLGYALFVLLWTLAAVSHAAVSTVLGFGLARFCLGLAESGNFPAAIRAVTECFPVEERALATGLFNSGSNAASLVAPFFVAFIVTRLHSWRFAFAGVGALGFAWLIFWLVFPYNKARTTQADAVVLEQTTDAAATQNVSWRALLAFRGTWAFIISKALTDPIWWLYMFWLPKFLQERFHLTMVQVGPLLATVYCVSTAGAVIGGWASGALIRRGIPALLARKYVLGGCAVLSVSLAIGTHLHTVTSTIILFSILTAAHQAWAANLFAANGEVFVQSRLSSAVGIAGAAGALGGVIFQLFTGEVLQWTHGNYTAIFILGGLAYPCSLLAFHALTQERPGAAA